MSGEAEHAASVATLREELEQFRLQGGISTEFVDWHGRLVACVEAITRDVPNCADLCAWLKSKNFEMPAEFAAKIATHLTDDPRIMAAASKDFFRGKCGEADELLNTLMIALRRASR
jgi:hypothetical protein